MRIWGIVLASLLVSAGCGKKDDDGAAKQDEPPETEEADEPETAEADTPDDPEQPEEEPEEEAKELPTPDDFDAAEPVHVTRLVAALAPWSEETELTVVGYPKFFIGDSGHLQRSAELVAEPGGDKETPTLVKCDMAEKHPDEVKNTETVVVTGELDGHWGDKEDQVISMKKCKVVETGAEIDADAPVNPDSDTPIPVGALHETYWGWIGKEVAVSGYYRGITTSRDHKNKKRILDVRVDISPSADERKDVLGCHLPKEEPDEALLEKMKENRADTVFRGTISEQVFGTWQLEPCQVVNR